MPVQDQEIDQKLSQLEDNLSSLPQQSQDTFSFEPSPKTLQTLTKSLTPVLHLMDPSLQITDDLVPSLTSAVCQALNDAVDAGVLDPSFQCSEPKSDTDLLVLTAQFQKLMKPQPKKAFQQFLAEEQPEKTPSVPEEEVQTPVNPKESLMASMMSQKPTMK